MDWGSRKFLGVFSVWNPCNATLGVEPAAEGAKWALTPSEVRLRESKAISFVPSKFSFLLRIQNKGSPPDLASRDSLVLFTFTFSTPHAVILRAGDGVRH